MGKSIRAKTKKRFRTVKRQLVAAAVDKPRALEAYTKCMVIGEGKSLEVKQNKNGFKYCDDPAAAFPQHELSKPFDFRSEALEQAGYAATRNRRKFKSEVDIANKRVVVAVDCGGSIKSALAAPGEEANVQPIVLSVKNVAALRDYARRFCKSACSRAFCEFLYS